MEQHITATIRHMAKSQKEIARILEAKRHVAVHMALTLHGVSDQGQPFDTMEELTEQSLGVKKNISSYLSSLADLEEAIAGNLEFVVREMKASDGEE